MSEATNTNLIQQYNKLALKFVLLYVIFASHIFILPNNVLDIVPFLNSYVEFMKEYFEIIKQIEIRTINFYQPAVLWSSNMLVSSPFLIVLIGRLGVYNIKSEQNWIGVAIRDGKIFKLLLYVAGAMILTYYTIIALNKGSIFDTSLHGYEKVNNINSEFGLFFFGGMLHLGTLIFLQDLLLFRIICLKYLTLKLKI